MTQVRPLMTNFEMIVRAECAVSACSPLPLSIKSLAPLIVRVLSPRQVFPFALVAGLWNEINFLFHQPGLFNGLWILSSQTPLSVTKEHSSGLQTQRLTEAPKHRKWTHPLSPRSLSDWINKDPQLLLFLWAAQGGPCGQINCIGAPCGFLGTLDFVLLKSCFGSS